MTPSCVELAVHMLRKCLYCAGGVIVSFFEWVQNQQTFRWEEEEVNRRLDRKMTDAFERIWDVHTTQKVPLRTAAYIIALRSVTQATMIRGFD